jgi:BlaI family transcriptional regulator, penicillinase repressor
MTFVVFNSIMKIQPEKIPDAERDVLVCLIQLGEATVKEIREALMPVRVLEPSSVLTLLKRLESRNLVAKRKADKGKAYLFRSTPDSSRACKHLVDDVFQRVFGSDTMAFMASFFETRKPTEEEINQLHQLLDDVRSKKKKDTKR